MPESVLTVFLYASITAIATGFGALPFLFFKKISQRWLGYSNAVAAGLMLTASFTLIFEGNHYGVWKTVIGVFVGLVFILLTHNWLDGREDLSISHLRGSDARKVILIIGVMTLHSFTEGVGVGVSFGGDEGLGIFITAAIALHNIPEGLAISLVMIPRGMRVWTTALYCIFTSLPQPLMAVPSYVFVEAFEPFLPFGLGFAGGAMIWMVFSEIIPEANEGNSSKHIGAIITVSIILMVLFQEYLR
ncbi:ZIP family metal transporter [Puniceicoccales bacterium CK1056]|uniref:ZIP family metal transporter n=1 Tax=Oceanipulchritudo coccoides TaxID=2706888 RepID=A0A6B2LX45_9BACT|nr:ZIP family metal transporter [Oceanipulchritudo coccoides]NDV61061.1 ZIP family metal transporter [Oceanipulchritudo coccoides]